MKVLRAFRIKSLSRADAYRVNPETGYLRQGKHDLPAHLQTGNIELLLMKGMR